MDNLILPELLNLIANETDDATKYSLDMAFDNDSKENIEEASYSIGQNGYYELSVIVSDGTVEK